jgi:hypothetical protein
MRRRERTRPDNERSDPGLLADGGLFPIPEPRRTPSRGEPSDDWRLIWRDFGFDDPSASK